MPNQNQVTPQQINQARLSAGLSVREAAKIAMADMGLSESARLAAYNALVCTRDRHGATALSRIQDYCERRDFKNAKPTPENIRRVRWHLGISLPECGLLLDRSAQSITDYEFGSTPMPVELWKAMRDCLDLKNEEVLMRIYPAGVPASRRGPRIALRAGEMLRPTRRQTPLPVADLKGKDLSQLITQASLLRENIAKALFADDDADKRLQKILHNKCVSPADATLVLNVVKKALHKRRGIDLMDQNTKSHRTFLRLQNAYGYRSQQVLCNTLKMPELGSATELPPKAWFAMMRLIAKIERKGVAIDAEIARIQGLIRAARS